MKLLLEPFCCCLLYIEEDTTSFATLVPVSKEAVGVKKRRGSLKYCCWDLDNWFSWKTKHLFFPWFFFQSVQLFTKWFASTVSMYRVHEWQILDGMSTAQLLDIPLWSSEPDGFMLLLWSDSVNFYCQSRFAMLLRLVNNPGCGRFKQRCWHVLNTADLIQEQDSY